MLMLPDTDWKPPVDQGSAEWGCSGKDIPGAYGITVGTGAANTKAIAAGCTTPGIAAKIASAYSLNGYHEWYLPSRDELNLLYAQKTVVGVFYYDFWSSTEVDSYGAWYQIFANGGRGDGYKGYSHPVRAVRSF